MDKNLYKKIDIYYIGYVTIKNIDDYENFHSVNPLYLIIREVDGYTEENNGNKYLFFASTDKNKKVLEKYTKFWDNRCGYSFLKEVSHKVLTYHASKKVRRRENFYIFNISHSHQFCVFSRNFYFSLTLSKQQLLHLFFGIFLRGKSTISPT